MIQLIHEPEFRYLSIELDRDFGRLDMHKVLHTVRGFSPEHLGKVCVQLKAAHVAVSKTDAASFGTALGCELRRLKSKICVIYPEVQSAKDQGFVAIDQAIANEHLMIAQFRYWPRAYDWLHRSAFEG